MDGSVVLQGFVVLLSRDVSVIPMQPKEMHGLGFELQGRTKGAHARHTEGTCLEEGTTGYDECERTHLRGVELPRVRLNILDQHVGQDDGLLCLVMERPAVRGQGGKGTGACSAQQLRQTTKAARVSEEG